MYRNVFLITAGHETYREVRRKKSAMSRCDDPVTDLHLGISG